MQKPCEIVKLLHSVFKVYWWLEFNEGLVHSNNSSNNNNNNNNNNSNNNDNNNCHIHIVFMQCLLRNAVVLQRF